MTRPEVVGNAASRDVALIRDDNGQHRLLKPLQPDERGVREALFYRTISQEFARLACTVRHRPTTSDAEFRFIPKYYGLYRMPGTDHFHVSLQNCIGHMRSPCIADIKIGRRAGRALLSVIADAVLQVVSRTTTRRHRTRS